MYLCRVCHIQPTHTTCCSSINPIVEGKGEKKSGSSLANMQQCSFREMSKRKWILPPTSIQWWLDTANNAATKIGWICDFHDGGTRFSSIRKPFENSSLSDIAKTTNIPLQSIYLFLKINFLNFLKRL